MGLSSTNTASTTASPVVTTVYTVSATFPDGCDLSDNVIVSVWDDPTVTINPQIAYACPSSSVQLSAGSATAVSYNWSSGGTGQLENVSPSGSTDYWVQVTDANGCIGYDTASVLVNSAVGTA